MVQRYGGSEGIKKKLRHAVTPESIDRLLQKYNDTQTASLDYDINRGDGEKIPFYEIVQATENDPQKALEAEEFRQLLLEALSEISAKKPLGAIVGYRLGVRPLNPQIKDKLLVLDQGLLYQAATTNRQTLVDILETSPEAFDKVNPWPLRAIPLLLALDGLSSVHYSREGIRQYEEKGKGLLYEIILNNPKYELLLENTALMDYLTSISLPPRHSVSRHK